VGLATSPLTWVIQRQHDEDGSANPSTRLGHQGIAFASFGLLDEGRGESNGVRCAVRIRTSLLRGCMLNVKRAVCGLTRSSS
jgi:hypothetical protein